MGTGHLFPDDVSRAQTRLVNTRGPAGPKERGKRGVLRNLSFLLFWFLISS